MVPQQQQQQKQQLFLQAQVVQLPYIQVYSATLNPAVTLEARALLLL
jgi:hypothetical protein